MSLQFWALIHIHQNTQLISDNGTTHSRSTPIIMQNRYTLCHQSAALDHKCRGRLRIKLAPQYSIRVKCNIQPEVIAIQPARVANIVIQQQP
jgi:hypothetical protein